MLPRRPDRLKGSRTSTEGKGRVVEWLKGDAGSLAVAHQPVVVPRQVCGDGACRPLVEVRGVQFGETGRLHREFFQGEDGISGANRYAGAAIDTFDRVYVELRGICKPLLVLLGVDAVHRAGLHAQFVLGTGVCDYICHVSR